MDDAKKYIIKTLDPMSSTEARQAIAIGKFIPGPIDSPNYKFAFSIIEAKEATERDARETRNLDNSEEALRVSRCATKIAISAMILSIATAIGIAIFQWLIKN